MQTGEVLRRVVFNLLDAAKGGKLKKLKEVNKREIVEGVTPEYMERRIDLLLDYVKNHSPYYKKHPEWTKLEDFPVMTKGDFLEHYEEVLVENSKEQGNLYRLSTSGSTGTPPACCWPISWGPDGSRADAGTTPGGRSWSITAPMS